MTSTSSHRIFISYGHGDAADLARRLRDDLEQLGHRVWLDESGIRGGPAWEDQIEREILGCDVFLALLSPHAVRRPDGVCLDEISLARYHGSCRLVPVMVLLCRPPLGIYRLQWLDFQYLRLEVRPLAPGGPIPDFCHALGPVPGNGGQRSRQLLGETHLAVFAGGKNRLN